LTGATGSQGNAGNNGIDGNDGAVGATGSQGNAGNNGLDGANGNDGAVGATGLTGAQGIQGIAGIDGQDGATGPIGVTGNTGASGIDGTNGIDGVDGYTPMFGVDYFNGTDGTDGVDGNDGAAGVQGPTGLTGNDGTNGLDGNNGIGINCWDANADGINDSLEDINNDGVWDALDCMWILQGAGSSLPVGVIQAYAGSSAPNDWLFCDGSAVSRTTYADLFTAIGESYGAGDGSTTFNLPDLRGRVPVGKDDMGGNAANTILTNGDTLGNSGGEETHILTESEMPSHSHAIGGDIYSSGGSYFLMNSNNSYNVNRYSSSEGGDQAHNNMQPYLITNYIIKVSEGSASSGGSVSGVTTLAPDNDADSTNEIQTLSLNGDTLSISGGNSVVLNNIGISSNTSNSTSIFNGISTPHNYITYYTDSFFIVPTGVNTIEITISGGKGGSGGSTVGPYNNNQNGCSFGGIPGGSGGYGGYCRGMLNVTYGDTISFVIGSNGVNGSTPTYWNANGSSGTNGSSTILYFGIEMIIECTTGLFGTGAICYTGSNNNNPGSNGSNGGVNYGNNFDYTGMIVFDTTPQASAMLKIRY